MQVKVLVRKVRNKAAGTIGETSDSCKVQFYPLASSRKQVLGEEGCHEHR